MIHEVSLEWDRVVHSSLRGHELPAKLHLPWDIDITDVYGTSILYEVGGQDERVTYHQVL